MRFVERKLEGDVTTKGYSVLSYDRYGSSKLKFKKGNFAGAIIKVKENRRNAMINQFDSAISSVEYAGLTAPLYLDQPVRSFRDDLQTLLNGI